MRKLSLAAAMALSLAFSPAAFAAAAAPLAEFEMMTWPEVKQALADGKTTARLRHHRSP